MYYQYGYYEKALKDYLNCHILNPKSIEILGKIIDCYHYMKKSD
jgi:hypothetical protein